MANTDDQNDEPVWAAVLERYRDAYGGEPDFDDRTDRHLLVTLMEEAVHDRVTRRLVEMFRRATAKIQAIGETRP